VRLCLHRPALSRHPFTSPFISDDQDSVLLPFPRLPACHENFSYQEPLPYTLRLVRGLHYWIGRHHCCQLGFYEVRFFHGIPEDWTCSEGGVSMCDHYYYR